MLQTHASAGADGDQCGDGHADATPSCTHDCPGGCGRRVPRHHFACRPCWYRLPVDLRRPIAATHGRDFGAHMAAMDDAIRWYATGLPLAVVLTCTDCDRSYEPTHQDLAAGRLGCPEPDCGGWTFSSRADRADHPHRPVQALREIAGVGS